MTQPFILTKTFFKTVMKSFSKRLKKEQKENKTFLPGEDIPQLLGNAIRDCLKEGINFIEKEDLDVAIQNIAKRTKCAMSWTHENEISSYIYAELDCLGSMAIASSGINYNFDVQCGDDIIKFLESDEGIFLSFLFFFLSQRQISILLLFFIRKSWWGLRGKHRAFRQDRHHQQLLICQIGLHSRQEDLQLQVKVIKKEKKKFSV